MSAITLRHARPAGWARALSRPSSLVALGLLAAVAVVWIGSFIVAAQPKSLDQRVYDVGSQLRCPSCNGETVAEAATPIAEQMRAVIRQKLQAGESERQVLADFRASYGDSIMAAPPVSGFTLLIWVAPFVMLALGALVVALVGREWAAARPALAHPATDAEDEGAVGLSAEERARLAAVLRRELAEEEGLPVGEVAPGGGGRPPDAPTAAATHAVGVRFIAPNGALRAAPANGPATEVAPEWPAATKSASADSEQSGAIADARMEQEGR